MISWDQVYFDNIFLPVFAKEFYHFIYNWVIRENHMLSFTYSFFFFNLYIYSVCICWNFCIEKINLLSIPASLKVLFFGDKEKTPASPAINPSFLEDFFVQI